MLVLIVITEDNALSISIEFEQENKKKINTPKRFFLETLRKGKLSINMIKKLYDVLAEEGIHLDSYQQEFLKAYKEFQDKKQSKFTLLCKNQIIQSVYLWGKVGRGKTLLLKALSQELSKNVLTTHFSEFMLQVHAFLKSHQGRKDPLTLFCKDVLQKVDLLLLDEFQIEDIGDAMIIGKVLNELRNHNTAIFLSSNYPVKELYKNGLQREKFIRSIKFIENEFFYFNLEGSEDYRALNIDNLLNLSQEEIHDQAIKKFLKSNFDRNAFFSGPLILSKRKFSAKGYGEQFVWLDFQVFFSESNMAKDYLELCETYSWVFINNFRKLSDLDINIVRRFISFLDVTYAKGSKVCALDKQDFIYNLYEGEILQHLWHRAQSRLQEALFVK